MPIALKCPRCGSSDLASFAVFASLWLNAASLTPRVAPSHDDLGDDDTVECRAVGDDDLPCGYRAPLVTFTSASDAGDDAEPVVLVDHSAEHGGSPPRPA